QSRRKAIQLLSEKTDMKKLPAGVSSLLADIGVSGSYEAFKNCLKSLENNIRPMDIESINLKPQAENKGGIFDNLGIFQFDLKINTYYQ
ncbi:MAG: hypothetical protein U9P63_02430, partial [Patescibacteria group bacterium]|nr:hypothetical protein [Patescibacteria group bacterium]